MMKLRILTVMLFALLAANCGGSSKGPGKIVNPPPITPPPVGTRPPPVLPGFGSNRGKLSIHAEEGGSVTTNPDVGTCTGRAYCDFTVNRGTVVTLTATPHTGWEFEEWDSCPGESGMQCIVTIDALTYVKAEFDPAP